MAKKKQTKKKNTSIWFCENCKTKEMTHAEMVNHLQGDHGMDTKKASADREMVLHLDGRDFFTSQYKVTVKYKDQEVVLTNSVMCHRADDDMMRYV